MQVVILAGGAKSTITDNLEGIPKPMALIGERPILWHIMKYFSTYNCKEFIICGGYVYRFSDGSIGRVGRGRDHHASAGARVRGGYSLCNGRGAGLGDRDVFRGGGGLSA